MGLALKTPSGWPWVRYRLFFAHPVGRRHLGGTPIKTPTDTLAFSPHHLPRLLVLAWRHLTAVHPHDTSVWVWQWLTRHSDLKAIVRLKRTHEMSYQGAHSWKNTWEQTIYRCVEHFHQVQCSVNHWSEAIIGKCFHVRVWSNDKTRRNVWGCFYHLPVELQQCAMRVLKI